MTECEDGALITKEVMGKVHAIRKAIRPLFTVLVTYTCVHNCYITEGLLYNI